MGWEERRRKRGEGKGEGDGRENIYEQEYVLLKRFIWDWETGGGKSELRGTRENAGKTDHMKSFTSVGVKVSAKRKYKRWKKCKIQINRN